MGGPESCWARVYEVTRKVGDGAPDIHSGREVLTAYKVGRTAHLGGREKEEPPRRIGEGDNARGGPG